MVGGDGAGDQQRTGGLSGTTGSYETTGRYRWEYPSVAPSVEQHDARYDDARQPAQTMQADAAPPPTCASSCRAPRRAARRRASTYDDYPRELPKREIEITEAAAAARRTPCTCTWTDRQPGSGHAKPPSTDGGCAVGGRGATQWKESPQAQEPVALGLSIVKPCFSMVSTKSIIAPLR